MAFSLFFGIVRREHQVGKSSRVSMDLLGAPMEGCVYLRVSFLCLLLRAVLCYCVRFYTSGGSGFFGFLFVVRFFTECCFFFC